MMTFNQQLVLYLCAVYIHIQMPLRREIASLFVKTLTRYPTDEEISVSSDSITFSLIIIIMVTIFPNLRLQLAEL